MALIISSGRKEGGQWREEYYNAVGFRAYFTCAIMGIAPISRSGRSPATAISYAVIEKRRVSAFEVLLGVVTGLASERACLQRLPGQDQRSVRCFGVGLHAAEKAAAELLEEGCAALLSFGIAGGLDYRLRPGSLVLAEAVVTERDECFATDPAWRGRLHACARSGSVCLGVFSAAIAPCSRPGKAEVASRLAAVAVDMESQAIARMARQAGVPFMAVRAVADPAERGIPEWLAGAINRRANLACWSLPRALSPMHGTYRVYSHWPATSERRCQLTPRRSRRGPDAGVSVSAPASRSPATAFSPGFRIRIEPGADCRAVCRAPLGRPCGIRAT